MAAEFSAFMEEPTFAQEPREARIGMPPRQVGPMPDVPNATGRSPPPDVRSSAETTTAWEQLEKGGA